MKTIDIEIAVMQMYGVRKNIIVPNCSWGIRRETIGELHECDLLILSKDNYATEIEIKISKQDLLKDKEKPHAHESDFIKRLFFAVPESLKDFALENIPKNAGLIIAKKKKGIDGYQTEVVKRSKLNKTHVQWTSQERFKLAELGCMRIIGLKKKIARRTYKTQNVY